MKNQPKNKGKGMASWKQILQVFLALAVWGGLVFGVGRWVESQFPDGAGKVCALDIGQGDATLFYGKSGKVVLIDGGPGTSILWKLSEQIPYFVNKIDLMIVTHPHTDHFVGFLDLLERYEVGQILVSSVIGGDPEWEIFCEKVRDLGIPVRYARADEDWWIEEGVTLDVIWPEDDAPWRTRNQNNASVAMRLESCREVRDCVSMLLAGDAEKEEEEILINLGVDLQSDILQVDHHGSKSSSTESFIDAVAPKEAWISAGRDNQFGHPHQEVLDRFEERGVVIRRTDLEGTICEEF